jgi:hypothetical protein
MKGSIELYNKLLLLATNVVVCIMYIYMFGCYHYHKSLPNSYFYYVQIKVGLVYIYLHVIFQKRFNKRPRKET